jgi:hypothetical protein
MALQVCMLLLILSQIITNLVVAPAQYIIRDLSLVGQLFVWCASLSLEFFEYVRALGHIWYLHPLLWWYSLFFYSFMLTAHIFEDDKVE